MHDFDVIVIGAGPGGYPAAIRSAQLGKKTAIVEREAYGGTCLNRGCIPTKTLIASAERFWAASHSEAYGVTVSGASADYGRMAARKTEVVGRLNKGVRALLKSNGVEMIEGTARFEAADRISVVRPGAPARWLGAGSVIIAAGSESAMPGFLPKSPNVVDSRAFLERTSLPERLLILGGGVIGCEFACMAAMLGTRVTVVEMLEDIVAPLDRDVRRVLRKKMESLGIELLTGAPMSDIAASGAGVTARFKDRKIEGDLLLVAVGRRPNSAALDLGRAGVAAGPHGTIPADAQCRTNVPSVFAVGDIVEGSVQLAHAATQQGIAAAEAAAGMKAKAEDVCPACIFTLPEIGLAGLSETRARQEGRAVKTGVFPFEALGKALASGEPDGFVKWIADPATGRILGAQAVGAHATDLISEAALAIRNELTVEEVARTIHCHPTFSEAWMEAANAWSGRCIDLPAAR